MFNETVALIIALMMTLVPLDRHKFHDESEESARDRYWTIANTIRAETDDIKLIAFLVTTARHESGFNHKVHSGVLRGDSRRSRGIYQVMCGVRPTCKIPLLPEFTGGDIVGIDYLHTRYSTYVGATHLRFHIGRCNGNPYCVFRNYLGAPRGSLSMELQARVNARVYTYQRILRLAEKKKE